MKKVVFFAFAIASLQSAFAQPASAEITRDQYGNKVVKGFLSKQELSTDTAFAWYATGQKSFTPNADAVKNMTAGKDAVHLLVFGGTWCGDTKDVLPKVFATAAAAGVADNRITLVGVDRSKKTLYNLSEAFGITNVPTFIVLKDGKEVGRVVEYGKTGMLDKEVAEMVASAGKK